MGTSGRQEQPGLAGAARPGGLSRRGILKGAAVTAGAVDAVMTATSPDCSNKITVSLVGGALSWSVVQA